MSNKPYIYDGIPVFLRNVVNFVLTQDPIKISSGFIIGLSVNKLFETFMTSLIKPILAMILFFLSKSGFTYTIAGQTFGIGSLITEIVLFFIFMISFYYLFINPVENLKKDYNVEQNTTVCPYCTTFISPLATRCPACTSNLPKDN